MGEHGAQSHSGSNRKDAASPPLRGVLLFLSGVFPRKDFRLFFFLPVDKVFGVWLVILLAFEPDVFAALYALVIGVFAALDAWEIGVFAALSSSVAFIRSSSFGTDALSSRLISSTFPSSGGPGFPPLATPPTTFTSPHIPHVRRTLFSYALRLLVFRIRTFTMCSSARHFLQCMRLAKDDMPSGGTFATSAAAR